MGAPTLEGAAAIFRYSEDGSAVERMRECVRAAINRAGGIAAEGSQDRSLARAPTTVLLSEPAPHIPNILHSTALRWAEEPTGDREELQTAFNEVAATWVPVAVSVRGVTAVF